MNVPAIIRPLARDVGDGPDTGPGQAAPSPRLSSRSIFGGARVVVIEHEGTEYRLQITGRGKLILTR